MYVACVLFCLAVLITMTDLVTQAVSYDPQPDRFEHREQIPPSRELYCNLDLDAQYAFWTKSDVWTRDAIASFHHHVDGVVDLFAAQSDPTLSEFMRHSWLVPYPSNTSSLE